VGGQQVEMVKFLLSKGADVNTIASYDRTPLDTAYNKGDKEMIRILLEHGADPALGRKIPKSFIEKLRK
jgi:ankyrin repeat protein